MALVEECGLHLVGSKELLQHSKLGHNSWAGSEFLNSYSIVAPVVLWAPSNKDF